ncbi:S8 family peptidase [Streptomyces nitrosporeus]|uniref:S8 family peptidase n=1 Tax=Streptomyces nitrosporeus TaxID=28894 RepID=UPI003D9DE015
MRRHVKSAYAPVVAVAAAVALAAGMTTPAAARTDRTPPSGTQGSEPVVQHHITLITGDRVAVDAEGRAVGFEPAEGREAIPVQRQTHGGHTYVVPADARRMVADGTLDRRLFDVTELSRPEYRGDRERELRLIVRYKGAAAADAKAGVRDAGGTEVGRTLRSLGAESLTTPEHDAQDIWRALTAASGTHAQRTTAAGVDRVWLDGVRRASLDRSVGQIGAPKAWDAGWTGKDVTIAVLDTGVDATHPDLKGQVVAERNFSAAADAVDRYGHGTHVASIAAGTGAKSGGKFKGVAPDASLLNGKVLDDDGYGDDSGILAGMEWAVAQGADIVNLSLGGADTPGTDPLEAAVDKLSAEKGVLFAIAAGNEGSGPGTVSSPGSADAALTVGAVDDQDALADFSSRGPRIDDGAVKPDVTAPGVDITAAAAPGSVIDEEVGQDPDGYLTISGTSMATPHVAGAAALLKQQHPQWTYAELKGALTASTVPGAYSAFEQGSGRIAVDRALVQTVVAEPVSVSFERQEWPHTDDTPVTRQVTYRNLGDQDVTLSLAASGTGPDGEPVPAGFLTLGAPEVTVPAGGRASVALTADTRLGTADGTYSGHVVATGGGQTVRTAVGIEREVESYDLTLTFTGRDGGPVDGSAQLIGTSAATEGVWKSLWSENGKATVRVPAGSYALDTSVDTDPRDPSAPVDWMAAPDLEVTKNLQVSLDTRTTKQTRISVPVAEAQVRMASADVLVEKEGNSFGFGWWLDSFDQLRTAHVGPAVTDGSLHQFWTGNWSKGAATEYDVVLGGPVTKLARGYTRALKAGQFSVVKAGMGASGKGKAGELLVWGTVPGMQGGTATSVPQPLPGTRTLYLADVDDAVYSFDFAQLGGFDEEGWPLYEAQYSLGEPRAYQAGKTYRRTVNTPVFGPLLGDGFGLHRDEEGISGRLPMAADGAGNPGGSLYPSATTVLYRNGKEIGRNNDPLTGEAEPFAVPAGSAAYRLTSSVRRSPSLAAGSSRIDAEWTFRSAKPFSPVLLPASMVRFTPEVALDGTVPAGKKATVPVKIQGPAAGKKSTALTVYVSGDSGKHWKKVPVKSGGISVTNPAKGKSLSFRAVLKDRRGNGLKLTVFDAYRGK